MMATEFFFLLQLNNEVASSPGPAHVPVTCSMVGETYPPETGQALETRRLVSGPWRQDDW